MGRFHAAKVEALARSDGGVALVGIADVDAERAASVAAEAAVPHATRAADLFPGADAAIVAVPTIAHLAVVREALRAGLDVLVEKPIAATVEEAETLLDLARTLGRVLQVGHLENFNSAMRGLPDRIRRPRFVEAHRLGPFPERGTDVDVVRDLMIHDLEIIQQLVGEEPERVEAIGVPVLTDCVDIANARVAFPGGCVANLTASRVSPTPMRKIRIFQANAYFSIDFIEQRLVIFRRERGAPGARPEIRMEKLAMDREDALLAQLRDFVDAVRTRRAPRVSGERALSALRTALRVIDAIPPIDEPL
ncbi:MAG: Gfo/Idh/MocA family oxidoreductase [Deltaproteobacteria bacterium]|nr:MAG: Gfo/Idh/MocA family oxidoreductase [Deltaproteobacteria bacterium]